MYWEKLTDERFAIMSASYEAEQKSLKETVAMLRNEIEAQDDKTSNVLAFVEKSSDTRKSRSLRLPLSMSLSRDRFKLDLLTN